MAFLESGVDSTKATVGTTSKALYTSPFDARGNFVGQKATYAACLALKTTLTAGTHTILAIYGSGSKTIRVQRIVVCATVATAAVYGDMTVKKTSTAISGAGTDLTQVPHDSTSAAGTANLVRVYAGAAPTSGTLVGYVGSLTGYCSITATPAVGPGIFDFDWRWRFESEAPVLRGTSEGLEVFFATTTTNAPTITAWVQWTEE